MLVYSMVNLPWDIPCQNNAGIPNQEDSMIQLAIFVPARVPVKLCAFHGESPAMNSCDARNLSGGTKALGVGIPFRCYHVDQGLTMGANIT
jgi:hypothetical protein